MYKILDIKWNKLPDGRIVVEEMTMSAKHQYSFQTKESAQEYLKNLGANIKLHEFGIIDVEEAKKISSQS
jgi:hypothetical protein